MANRGSAHGLPQECAASSARMQDRNDSKHDTSDMAKSSSTVMASQVGNVYSIVREKLSFAIIRSHDEAIQFQGALPDKYLFTADFQDLYKPINKDFGPVNIGIVHSFCMFMRKMFDCAQGQELVYYSVCSLSCAFHRTRHFSTLA
jgi:hypothetical protein